MCTLTYLLNDNGYELFFNRDELRTRQPAIAPAFNHQLNTIYPVDPDGKGTWIAAHQSGLSLALLNFYQAEQAVNNSNYLSRGQIILSLLEDPANVIGRLKKMDLQKYMAFKLCIFASDLSKTNNKMRSLQWDGKVLSEVAESQPIISAGAEFALISKIRKARFRQIISAEKPRREQFLTYHNLQEVNPHLSVKMERPEARTVSFSHLVVGEEIEFHYADYIAKQEFCCRMARTFS
ncbi:NRDE family protein [Psychromonas sp.]|uniref:NRDE family protein n=1 Tax=Psychromonas sp. TaxID=1884585 RepID=UPI003562FA83